MYGRKTPNTSYTRSTASIHSTGRSLSNLQSQKSRSMKSVKIPWYQKPILHNNKYINVQRGAMLAAVFTLFLSIFTIVTAVFDIYCLSMAAPGSTHYGYYFISYEFVYVGNRYVRNILVMFALFSFLAGLAVFVTSILLTVALRKEYEEKILPWLWTMAIFTILRSLAWLFFSIVNDLIFAYNIFICLAWVIIIVLSIWSWLVVYSLYVELKDLSKLEDLAHLRMGTMASVHASTNPSLAGSRPTTPYIASSIP
ncbi:uncharacterized protein LOC116342476 [Contarinia nasturtii]|uniref:uncharacterized protein LOC116342476 n=1 Tax=Contarinia nasturtii TaxID=265458 RepID=UPI0012D41428|nr:uncharacterized protein LOC116342476 [Contarinia nasturtii]